MIRRPPRSTRTDTLFPYTTLFRSGIFGGISTNTPNRRYPQMPLKDLEVKYATRRQRPYKLSDGGGLHLLVQPRGAKLWRLNYRFDGKEKLLSLGKYHAVPLAFARARREGTRRLQGDGRGEGE